MTGSRLGDVDRFDVSLAVADATDRALQDAGRRGHEAFVLWTGTVVGPAFTAAAAYVPEQTAHRLPDGVCVTVGGDALHQLNRWLYDNEQCLAVQVHTHPGRAYHSTTDSAYPIVTQTGGLSLVVPDFASGGVRGPGTALYRLGGRGWRQVRRRAARRLLLLGTDEVPGRGTLMALAPYYDKAAVAASQVVAGFRPDAFREALEGIAVGVSFGDQAARSPEGQALLDLQVRLLARLYPALALRPDGPAAHNEARRLAALARAINPRIDLVDDANVGIVAGVGAPTWTRTVHVGSDGWTGRAGGDEPLAVGSTSLPFGAAAAACLAASAVFRLLLDPAAPRPGPATLSCADGAASARLGDPPPGGWALPDRVVLVGCGAIGQAAVWALAASPISGTVHVVDSEAVDDGNLQRYVLSGVADVGRRKADLAADHVNAHALGGRLRAVPVDAPWAQAHARLEPGGWDHALAAVDSAAARRAIQASLPAWTANAWTQPGDLGVSDHDFERGACLACLYQPTAAGRDEDDIVAEALGVPEARAHVRTWLHTGEPPPAGFLDLVAARLGADPADLAPFAGRGIRSLYVDGICGGQVLPLGSRKAGNDVHVPLAHQSALAGVLLAARLVRRAAGHVAPTTEITRLDVRSDPPARPTQPAGKDPAARCLCQDLDYQDAYRAAWR